MSVKERLMEVLDLPNAPSPPTRKRVTGRDVARLIKAEAAAAGVECTTETATAIINFFAQARDAALSEGSFGEVRVRRSYSLYQVHLVLDVVVPDDQVTSPAGSAKEALELHLGTDANPVVINHTINDLYIEEDQCVVQVTVATVNLS